ncbi:MAG: HPr-rel-A system PqqD family peptide chaperone [Pseudomonadota bacterium]
MAFWSPVPVASFKFHKWEGDEFSAVYVVSTGDTHLLEWWALELLCLIQVSPRTTQGLTIALTELMTIGEFDKSVEFVDATLFKLLEAGLVVRTSH